MEPPGHRRSCSDPPGLQWHAIPFLRCGLRCMAEHWSCCKRRRLDQGPGLPLHPVRREVSPPSRDLPQPITFFPVGGPGRTTYRTVPEVQPAILNPPLAAALRALFAACLELERAVREVVRATRALEPVPGSAAERCTTRLGAPAAL